MPSIWEGEEGGRERCGWGRKRRRKEGLGDRGREMGKEKGEREERKGAEELTFHERG